MSDELISCFADMEKLCSHVHLPFQSGSDRVLKLMNRRYTRARYLGLIDRLKEARPDIAFSADVIVGFPGETETDYEDTLALIREVRFDLLYSFNYSPRPGTAAAGYKDSVPREEKSRRLTELQALQRAVTLEINQGRTGKIYTVLVDGVSARDPGQVHGRTTQNAIVNFTGPAELIGRTVRVRVTRANPNSLTGELCADEPEHGAVTA
jgi:tRNA-2-methylthio-N6-dimethylallyladenosine synthase